MSFIAAGDLDRRVTLRINSITGQSLSGAPVKGISEQTDIPAAFRPLTGNEMIKGGQIAADFNARFVMRYRSDIKPKDEIDCDGKTYDIISVGEIGRREGIEIMALARNV